MRRQPRSSRPGWLRSKLRLDTERQAGEQQVAVSAAAEPPVFPEAVLHLHLARDELGPVVFLFAIRDVYDFLEGDDVRVHLTQHLRDALRPDTAVESPAFMNVVGNDAERLAPLGLRPSAACRYLGCYCPPQRP